MSHSKDSQQTAVDRREFLKSGALAGAAALVTPTAVTRRKVVRQVRDSAPPRCRSVISSRMCAHRAEKCPRTP
jgi:hypothetical protein